jgi:hypothetical protein
MDGAQPRSRRQPLLQRRLQRIQRLHGMGLSMLDLAAMRTQTMYNWLPCAACESGARQGMAELHSGRPTLGLCACAYLVGAPAHGALHLAWQVKRRQPRLGHLGGGRAPGRQSPRAEQGSRSTL